MGKIAKGSDIWNKVLSNQTSLDIDTFLITNLINIRYTETRNMIYFACVDYSDLRKHTSRATEVFNRLKSKGYAKELRGKEDTTFIIGEYKNMFQETFYFYTQQTASKLARTRVTKKVASLDTSYIKGIKDVLQPYIDRYADFCKLINLHSQASKVNTKLSDIFLKAETGKITIPDLLSYLDCVNAIVNDWVKIPDRYNNLKERSTATAVLGKATLQKVMEVVPYFVLNYPERAKAGYESTNIFMLNFHIQTMIKLQQDNNKKPISYERDSL